MAVDFFSVTMSVLILPWH